MEKKRVWLRDNEPDYYKEYVLSGVRHFVTHQKKHYSFIYRYGGDFF